MCGNAGTLVFLENVWFAPCGNDIIFFEFSKLLATNSTSLTSSVRCMAMLALFVLKIVPFSWNVFYYVVSWH